jgi:hypothetical protein
MTLRAAGSCAEAIPLFEESRRLRPAPGKDFYLADCHEAAGRLKTAWSLFVDVVAAAEVMGKKALQKDAQVRVAQLEPRVPRLKVVVPAELRDLPGLTIELDGKPIPRAAWGTALWVDPGPHVVVAAAAGKQRVEAAATCAAGASIEVPVPVLPDVTETRSDGSLTARPWKSVSVHLWSTGERITSDGFGAARARQAA